jgi:anti-sigma factor RsiW
MLRCQDVAEQASDYVDRTLTWHRRGAIWLHLMLCDACRRYVRQMRATVVLLRTMGEPRLDAEKQHAASTTEWARQLFRDAR